MSGPEATTGDLPRVSVGVSAVSVLSVVALLAPAPAPLGVALVGGVLLAAGLAWRRELPLALGGSALFGAVVLAGVDGRSRAWLLAASIPAVLAWASGRYAVRLGRQLGGATGTRRVALVHAVASLATLVAGAGAGYLLSRTVGGGESPLALGLLLVAVVAFTVALRG